MQLKAAELTTCLLTRNTFRLIVKNCRGCAARTQAWVLRQFAVFLSQTRSGDFILFVEYFIFTFNRIKMCIDGGAKGVIAPYIETVDQVKVLIGGAKLRPLLGQSLQTCLNLMR